MPEMLLFETDRTVQNIFVSENKFEKFQMHSHDFYEFEYVLEGKGKCYINGEEYKFEKGDVSFATPMDIHGYSSEQSLKVLSIHFRTSSLDRKLSGISHMEACVTKAGKAMQNAFEVLKIADRKDRLGGMLVEKAMEMIVIMFLQSVKEDTIRNMPREINCAVEYINTNFKEKIDLKTVSNIVGCSKEHFCRQFKKYTGVSFLEYLSRVRVEYGKNLLLNSNHSVTDICFECGFGCLRSFNRAFNEKYGCSPKKYQFVSKNNQNVDCF